jgi:aerobic-type carbon monoxide dehydrogenase small subunit (CoxS/CutS family)
MKADIELVVNGRRRSLSVATSKTLAEVIREDFYLSGCRIACDGEVCGACTVLLDGQPTAACSTLAFQADGRQVETIEGLSEGAKLHPIQQAFLETNAFQCGFCTAGFVLSVKALLASQPDPDERAIEEWLKSNVCRCTGYKTILQATQLAASRLKVSA